MKADVLKWTAAIKYGWKFHSFSSVVWLKDLDYANVMIQMAHI